MPDEFEAKAVEGLTIRENAVVELILAQPRVSEILQKGAALEIRASADARQNALFPFSAVIEVNSGEANAALRAVEDAPAGFGLILIHNALPFLVETRRFLAACFAKLAVGGVMVVTTPHQFLYERKLRLPSRRDPRHRRFFTPNTLMAEIEEALDPCAYRLRFLADSDAGYDYNAGIEAAPAGAQDIVAALEKIPTPPWRDALDRDELWARTPTQPTRFLPIDREAPALVRTIAPDRRAIRRVIALKLDHRGDFLMATEAFKILRSSFADAELTLVCGSWNVAEAEKLGWFDKIVPFDFHPEDDSARQEMPPRDVLISKFANQMRGEQYDLAIDLRLYEDTREVLQAIKARNRAGFDRYDSFPWLTIRLNTPSATDDDRAESVLLNAERFSTSIGRHLGYEIVCDAFAPRDPQALIWGPYNALNSGHYRFECLAEPLAEDFEAPFDIVVRSGNLPLLVGLLRVSRQRSEIWLDVDRPYDSFEFRINLRPGHVIRPFRFFGLRYVRLGASRGQHQVEAMALLAHLTTMRMRDAYGAETL